MSLRSLLSALALSPLCLGCATVSDFINDVEFPETAACAKVPAIAGDILAVLLSDAQDRDAWIALGKEHGFDALVCGTQSAIEQLKSGTDDERHRAALELAQEWLSDAGTILK